MKGWIVFFVLLACFMSACDALRGKDETPRRPTGRELRYEALGHYKGKVRMVHPSGREAWGPREGVARMRRAGWVLAPE